MTLHTFISNKISNFLNTFYYNYLKKIYNNDLCTLFKMNNLPIFKPEYFIFLQSYTTYLFFHYLINRSFLLYSISLHSIHICTHLSKKLCFQHNYTPTHNIYFIKDVNYLLFTYLLYTDIFFKKAFYTKFLMIICIGITHLLSNINYIYRKRLKSIEEKTELKHIYKILIITPDKNKIIKIIDMTQKFNYSTFLIITNIILYFFY
jgi:hypothetical protein